jgi:hypothetical protein
VVPSQERSTHKRGTVDIRVEDADLQPERGESKREIARRRGLSDAGLAGGDRDDMLDTRNASWLRCRARLRFGLGNGHTNLPTDLLQRV